MSLNMQYPYYEVEISTRGCSIELFINDVLIFSNYENGSMAVDWPINQWIVESGKQSIRAKIFPFKGQAYILKKAGVDIKVFVKDISLENQVRKNILSFPHITFNSDTEFPFFSTEELSFSAEVPYSLKGWKNSVDLRKINQDILLGELSSWYDKFHKVFITQNYQYYNELNYDRYEDMKKSFYLTEDEEKELDFFKDIPPNIAKVPLENYQLTFYANGRLVGLKLPYEMCGFMFKLELETPRENDNFIELALFHLKSLSNELSLIR